MNHPKPDDYIDMHTHGGKPSEGMFIIECLMAHEEKIPDDTAGIAYTFGVHPWFLNDTNYRQQLQVVENSINHSNVVAIGEAGFDKLKGPSLELQTRVFEEQVIMAENCRKPVIIHCVKAWDELLAVRKRLKPTTPWMIHGFRGSSNLADQLSSKGLHLSYWFDWVLRPESSAFFSKLSHERIFLETDGADVNIKDIYNKIANDLGIGVSELKTLILRNYNNFFQY